MPEAILSPKEEIRILREENKTLRGEQDKLGLELKKLARELRISKNFLENVTKSAEAKDTLNNALSEANIRQRAYTDMLLKSCPNIIILLDDDGRFVLSTEILMTVTNTPNLKMLLDNMHSIFSMLCREKELEMKCVVADNLLELVMGDEIRLRQILTNLLSNAVKYTKQGSVSFSAWMDERNFLRFDITDTGIGIREEDREKLFKPFEQLDVRKNRNVVGTGLGLAITYNLCRIMGGDLSFYSVYGEGATFSVCLPYVEADRTIQEEVRKISDFIAPAAKILVVDDIEINLAVVEALLSTFDIIPDLATSGKEAIQFAENNRYDIIFYGSHDA
ncbi:MAG: ATP-binding protein [Acidobacteria bacterium]|nr:ATP-binding protein [Acidobacteriota bacterium]